MLNITRNQSGDSAAVMLEAQEGASFRILFLKFVLLMTLKKGYVEYRKVRSM